MLRSVDKDRLQLDLPSTGHVAILGLDHVYSFLSDPARDTGTTKHGFLQLLVQLVLDGSMIHVEPLPAPGVSAAPLVTARRQEPVLTTPHMAARKMRRLVEQAG